MVMHGLALAALQIIAVDVYSDRRTNTFLFDMVTEKSEEKTSDREQRIQEDQAAELQAMLDKK